jgi:hypothetical protein
MSTMSYTIMIQQQISGRHVHRSSRAHYSLASPPLQLSPIPHSAIGFYIDTNVNLTNFHL